jgi:hypothetical protein
MMADKKQGKPSISIITQFYPPDYAAWTLDKIEAKKERD